MSRQELDLGKLDQFTPRASAGAAAGDTLSADAQSGSGPTGPGMAGQGMKAGRQRLLDDPSPAARFRRLAKADRYTLGAFLTLLMDGYEGRE